LDVVEDERLADARTLRQAHDGAELDIPVDLGVNLGELALRLERGDPAAQIAEGRGLARDGHGLGAGLEQAHHDPTRAAMAYLVLCQPGPCAGHPRLSSRMPRRRGWPGQARP